LTPELAHELTWEASTDRFIETARITEEEARNRARVGKSKLDERIAWFHNEMGKGKKGDALRKVLGAGPISDQVRYEMMKRGELDDDNDQSYDVDGKFDDSSWRSVAYSLLSGASTPMV